MRAKKIRGQKRRLNDIKRWREKELQLSLDHLFKRNSDHVELIVHPWCDLSLSNSIIPQPKGDIKNQMLDSLLDIYQSWKQTLDSLNEPYYLKVWLFEPRFNQSQVVCAIRDSIKYYEEGFFVPLHTKKLNRNFQSDLLLRLNNFHWKYYDDEDHWTLNDIGTQDQYDSHEDYLKSKSDFEKLLKKQHRTWETKDENGENLAVHSFKRGDLWVGGL